MDFKMIFRYQLSGTVFIIWLLMFNLSVTSASFQDMFTKISSFELSNIFTAVAVGIPIGTIIHQISIFLKNCIFGKLFGLPYFVDSMKDDAKLTDCIARKYKDLDSSIVNDKITSTHKKMSDLNTFYYLRFDNGLIAPLFAYIIFTINQSLANGTLWCQGSLFCISLIVVVFLLLPILLKTKSIYSIIKSNCPKKCIIILLFMMAGGDLICTAIFDGSFFTNQNKNYIHVENYTTINNTSESIISSYVSSDSMKSIGYGFRGIHNYKTSINLNDYCQSCTKNFSLPTGNISKIITSNKYQKIVQTPIDNRLQLITEITALIYMVLMAIYIHVLYNQRKECWEYYFGIFNKYFVCEDVSINTHLFNEYQNGSFKVYIDLSIHGHGLNKNINNKEKASQKYSKDEFDLDKISQELVKQVTINQHVTKNKIKDILKIIKNQLEIYHKKYKTN